MFAKMNKLRNQRWHEPEQEQFWRYMKDNKVLETIQPALTLLYELPVKPTDLFSYFAEFLDNGAQTAIQLSLLRAELCFKQNQLEETKGSGKVEPNQATLLEPALANTPKQNPLNDGKSDGSDVTSDGNSPRGALSVDSFTFPGHEMDSIVEFIEEYQELDPFGILFDFHVHESETYEAAAENEQAKLDEMMMKEESRRNTLLRNQQRSHEKISMSGPNFFDLKPAQSIDQIIDPKRDLRPMEKLLAGLRKFEERNKQESFDPENEYDSNEARSYDNERSFLDVSSDTEISTRNSTRKRLMRVFDTPSADKDNNEMSKKERKAHLKSLTKKYFKQLQQKYKPKKVPVKSENLYYDIGTNKQIQQREKLQRSLGFRGGVPIEDEDDDVFLTQFDAATGRLKNEKRLRTKPEFVYDFPLDEVLRTQEWIDEYFPESIWKLNEPMDPNKKEDSDDFDDDEDDNYVWLQDLKDSCNARVSTSDPNLALPSAILENLHKGALSKIRKKKYAAAENSKRNNELPSQPCQAKPEIENVNFIEESSLPKPKKLPSVPSLLKVPSTDDDKMSIIKRTDKRSEQAKAYVRDMFSDKYRKQLMTKFHFEMLDD